ncbi:MarR family winged helix-turn-helix transcriptional regulator [Cryptosporangium sp. NPDC051539]|uniref:MarR family winged helix-turn-helix transcriptional regulator n=1 Tax=Cryptosporangium sp. NPDC051539 TaxID=3363962 RepID=UPI0037ADD8AF
MHTQQTSLDDSVGFVLAELGKVALARGDQVLASLGFTARHLRILEMASAEQQSQQQLSARAGVDRTTMVALVDDFERLGLAERRKDAADRRRYVVGLTAKGREALDAGRAAIAAAEDEMFGPLTLEEREQLRDLAHRVLRQSGTIVC